MCYFVEKKASWEQIFQRTAVIDCFQFVGMALLGILCDIQHQTNFSRELRGAIAHNLFLNWQILQAAWPLQEPWQQRYQNYWINMQVRK